MEKDNNEPCDAIDTSRNETHQSPSDRVLNIIAPSFTVEENQEPSQLTRELPHRDTMYSEDNPKYCWVCFATDQDDKESSGEGIQFITPCKCKGTLKNVHQNCLQRWVDEKQKGNAHKRVFCQQCQTEYLIQFPSDTITDILEAIDTLIRRSSPFMAAGAFVASLYWTAVTYGSVTVLQVLGQDAGLEMLESTDSIFLLISLPAIPVCLVLGRMIRWEDFILRYLQNRQRKNHRLLSLILPIPDDSPSDQQAAIENQVSRNSLSDTLSTTRILCGALLLPSISSFVGKVFCSNVESNLNRCLLGGLIFISVKGIFKIYFKQKQFIRKKQRKIVDYTDENLRRFQRVPDIH